MNPETTAQIDSKGRAWIQTFSGKAFPLAEPKGENFDLIDIGSHLSRINRYTGAIQPECYSVAEHSVRVAYYTRALVAREIGTKDPHVLRAAFRAGLMHDAAEAYLNDLSSPLKRLPELEGYRALHVRYEMKLAKRFALTEFKNAAGVDLVRDADLSLLDFERPKVLGQPPEPWRDLGLLPKVEKPFPADPLFARWGWNPNLARSTFMRAAAGSGL